jgi:phosphodiesterase/alkaline phosphatase D-like protein
MISTVVAARGSRSAILAGCVSAALALVSAPSAGAAAVGFDFGVAAGDVTSRSAILWARADRTGNAVVQVTRGTTFGRCRLGAGLGSVGAGIGIRVKVLAGNDRTVQKRVGGLEPGTTYRYRFCMRGGAHSATGTFETAPRPNRPKAIRFAVSSDQDALPGPGQRRPFWSRFQIWDPIREERNDFNVLLGGSILSDTEVPGHRLSEVATTVPEKWRKYRLNLDLAPWATTRGSAAYYAHWGDGEFVNDFSPLQNRFPLSVGTLRINGKVLYKRGVKAFRDYNPITFSKRNGIYRRFRWGKNLEVFFLDERSFRSPLADARRACDNPPGSGNPDLMPTAPQRNRNALSIIVPQLASPPPAGCRTRLNDPGRTMLGSGQLARFKRDIQSSKAAFKVIFSEVPIQEYFVGPYDRWEGYVAERAKLLRFLKKNVKNAIFLSGDAHAALANGIRSQTLEPGGPVGSGIQELTAGPLSTAPYGFELSQSLRNPNAGVLFHDGFFKPQPPNGVGIQCAAMDQFNYAQVTVTASRLTVQLKNIKGERVKDTADKESPAPFCPTFVFPRK